ncbi:MAG: hydrogenase maturation protease [Dehalococcoidia bacterium]|nr:hydrogenase maturation protease [Dehalococcoidia bacterium]
MKTLVLGLGNPYLTDDCVGIRVVVELQSRFKREDVTMEETSLSGLGLLEVLVGYDRVIIVDAIQTREGKPGEIHRLGPEVFEVARHLSSVHDLDFPTALDFGRRVGLSLPREIIIFGVEGSDTSSFSEECTPEVRKAIPRCVELVLEELAADQQAL